MSSSGSQLAALCRDHGVASLYAFGSRAAEAIRLVSSGADRLSEAPSDLDLAVVPDAGGAMTARDRVRLAIALESFFGASRVDLVVLPEAAPFLAADAVRGELLYCDDPDRQAREELYFLRRAADLAPFQRERQEGLLSGELET